MTDETITIEIPVAMAEHWVEVGTYTVLRDACLQALEARQPLDEGDTVRCCRCDRTVAWQWMDSRCPNAPDSGPHEGVVPVPCRPTGWSTHARECPRARPWAVGTEILDAACTCRVAPQPKPLVITDCIGQTTDQGYEIIAARKFRGGQEAVVWEEASGYGFRYPSSVLTIGGRSLTWPEDPS